MVRGTFPWPQGAGGTVCVCKGDMRIIIHTYIKHFSSNVYKDVLSVHVPVSVVLCLSLLPQRRCHFPDVA